MVKAKFGYSFIEIITVVAIITFITAVGIVNFRQGESNSYLQLKTEEIINVFRGLQIQALNNVRHENQQPLGGYGWVVNDLDGDGLSYSYSIFIRTQNVSGPYNQLVDVIISSTTLSTGLALKPGSVLTLNFKPINGAIEAYQSDGQAVSAPIVGLIYDRLSDYYFNILVNSQSGIITSQQVFSPPAGGDPVL
jgi:Tfp pilus assembly protein FimT